jgi:tetratricopeptide (TPR) repeat protein
MPDAWQEGNRRLFDYFRRTEETVAGTHNEFKQLHTAIRYGIEAGQYLPVFDQVIWPKLCHGLAGFKMHDVGLTREDEQAVRLYFPNALTRDPLEVIEKTFATIDLARLNYWAGLVAHGSGNPSEAALHNEHAAELFEKAGDYRGAAFATGYRARSLTVVGNIPKALLAGKRCLQIVKERLDSQPGLWSLAKGVYARALHAAGHWNDAGEAFREARSCWAKSPQPTFSGIATFHDAQYGEYLLDEHELLDKPLAEDELQGVLHSLRHSGLGEALAGLILGRWRLLRGDIPAALGHVEAAVDTLLDLQIHELMIRGRLGRVWLYRARGELPLARKEVEAATDRARHHHLRLCQIDCLIASAAISITEEDGRVAADRLAAAEDLIAECGYHRAEPRLRQLRKRLAGASGLSPESNPQPGLFTSHADYVI